MKKHHDIIQKLLPKNYNIIVNSDKSKNLEIFLEYNSKKFKMSRLIASRYGFCITNDNFEEFVNGLSPQDFLRFHRAFNDTLSSIQSQIDEYQQLVK